MCLLDPQEPENERCTIMFFNSHLISYFFLNVYVMFIRKWIKCTSFVSIFSGSQEYLSFSNFKVYISIILILCI